MADIPIVHRRFMSLKNAARLLGTSPSTLRRRAAQNCSILVKHGTRTFVDMSSVIDQLDSLRLNWQLIGVEFRTTKAPPLNTSKSKE